MHINQYEVLQKIGSGACGTVFLVKEAKTGKLLAVKRVKNGAAFTKNGKLAATLRNEVEAIKKLRHPNIMSITEFLNDPDAEYLYLVMDYVQGGPIATIKPKQGLSKVCPPIQEPLLLDYSIQLLEGLHFLHSHKVVHRDIKPENILLDCNGRVVLADFGVAEAFVASFNDRIRDKMMASMRCSMAMSAADPSAFLGPKVFGKRGTLLFLAPELWLGLDAAGFPVDIWATGITIYVLLSGNMPFRNTDDISKGQFALPENVHDEWNSLLLGMLAFEPHKRWSSSRSLEYLRQMKQTMHFADCAPQNTSQQDNMDSVSISSEQRSETSSAMSSTCSTLVDFGFSLSQAAYDRTVTPTRPPLVASRLADPSHADSLPPSPVCSDSLDSSLQTVSFLSPDPLAETVRKHSEAVVSTPILQVLPVDQEKMSTPVSASSGGLTKSGDTPKVTQSPEKLPGIGKKTPVSHAKSVLPALGGTPHEMRRTSSTAVASQLQFNAPHKRTSTYHSVDSMPAVATAGRKDSGPSKKKK
ncbi:protein kinase [Angomonas deanei]|uniref:non-specific serine/threonine protein kinase n=1 Tax=Angomonas deanei TaxID=59799 RepID=A0A7G2CUV5_9TRYP|nr:protein kinase [Angomonas deanei]CAD2222851.1 Protein kinase domain/Protein tyrosine kinase/Kinase-like, putative [Angomonas deanei]|eukprot:EPY21743.1 protein kinase [Angomonas deanei]